MDTKMKKEEEFYPVMEGLSVTIKMIQVNDQRNEDVFF